MGLPLIVLILKHNGFEEIPQRLIAVLVSRAPYHLRQGHSCWDSPNHQALCERLIPVKPGGPLCSFPAAVLTWSRTQCPPLDAFSSAISATASWPCPKDTLWNFPESIVNPSLLPVGGYSTVREKVNQREMRRIWNSTVQCSPVVTPPTF